MAKEVEAEILEKLEPLIEHTFQVLECELEFKCPKKWGDLHKTDDPKKRFCVECGRDVHLATTREAIDELSAERKCVAAYGIDVAGNKRPPMMLVGVFVSPDSEAGQRISATEVPLLAERDKSRRKENTEPPPERIR